MLKALQGRLQHYVNWECPDVQAGFRKGREQEVKLPTSVGSTKTSEFQKNLFFGFIDCVDHNQQKFFKMWEYQTTLPATWEICIQIEKEQLELGMEQWTGSKEEKEYIKAVYCHPAY